MRSQEKDKFICEKLGERWFDDRTLQHRNPDFTSEAGRVQLLKLMWDKMYWGAFAAYIEHISKGTDTSLLLYDDNGKFRDAVFEWLGGTE